MAMRKCGHEPTSLANVGPTPCAGAGTDRGPESRPSVLGLSPDLGAVALRGGTARQQKADLAAHAGARLGARQSAFEGDSDLDARLDLAVQRQVPLGTRDHGLHL